MVTARSRCALGIPGRKPEGSGRQARWIAAVLLGMLGGAEFAQADLPGYLARPEPQARWEKRATERADGAEIIDLELVSQVWRDIPWTHPVRIFRPDPPAHPGAAILLITGGGGVWLKTPAFGVRLAQAAGVPVAVLTSVPNQPLFGGRKEDDLVAHTFEEYIKTGDEEWPLLFPMTKAAVKAMDAVQELSRKEWGAPIERFIVTGASKRGWTTWLTGASDPRVAGIVPQVYDNLNFEPQMKNQIDTWGRYSEKIGDYTTRGLQAMLATEPGRKLAAMVDPYAYRERLARVPKLIVNGTNDPYWALDALNIYWDALGGEKSVLYVPNAGHGLSSDLRVVNASVAFARRVAAGKPMPALRWEHGEREGKLTLRMTCDEAPADARLWTAASPTRDFRKAQWSSQPARKEEASFVAEVGRPAEGFLAWFGEADYKDEDRAFGLSTTLRIVGAK